MLQPCIPILHINFQRRPHHKSFICMSTCKENLHRKLSGVDYLWKILSRFLSKISSAILFNCLCKKTFWCGRGLRVSQDRMSWNRTHMNLWVAHRLRLHELIAHMGAVIYEQNHSARWGLEAVLVGHRSKTWSPSGSLRRRGCKTRFSTKKGKKRRCLSSIARPQWPGPHARLAKSILKSPPGEIPPESDFLKLTLHPNRLLVHQVSAFRHI